MMENNDLELFIDRKDPYNVPEGKLEFLMEQTGRILDKMEKAKYTGDGYWRLKGGYDQYTEQIMEERMRLNRIELGIAKVRLYPPE